MSPNLTHASASRACAHGAPSLAIGLPVTPGRARAADRPPTSAATCCAASNLSGTPWVQVLRSNRKDLDPLYFAIYGEAIYHHGAGLTGGLSPAHRAQAPAPLPLPRAPGLHSAVRLLNRQRWRRWERARERQSARESQAVYERIKAGGSEWLDELM